MLVNEMLTGEKSGKAGNVEELMWLHVDTELPRLPVKLARYPPLGDKPLAKDPARRFQDAADVVALIGA